MKLLRFSFISLLIIIVFSCTDNEEEILPDTNENVITDTDGITIRLEWSTGGSDDQAQDDVDLELFLSRNGNEVDASDEFGFEQVQLQNINDDGRYIVAAQYFSGEKDIDYDFNLTGIESGESLSYSGSISAEDQGLTINYLEIQKDGELYSINEL
ncbi:hypothetical protein GCM10011506_43490 [Marivirga lumbricoides]|uniref:Uncharacterized protein n=1 Tax=Marivirga lumbricoides TaxID=1046115 RepID=A0ABQ1N8D1_9BACT|nr:hypothetical protein GCM10011506_43490 [Marivirga lumbricoides]